MENFIDQFTRNTFSFYIERVHISYTIYNPFKFPTIHLSLITIDYIINYILIILTKFVHANVLFIFPRPLIIV